MDFISFIIVCLITLAIAYAGTWLIGMLIPTHPAIIDRIIWAVAVIIIVWTLVRATGILSYAPQIPHV